MKRWVNLIGIAIFFIVLVISVGYAAFVDSLSIGSVAAVVRPEKLTRITSVSTSSSSISNLDYNMYEITSAADIADGETVTFNTTITTFGSIKAALSDIKVFNNSTEITSSVGITPDFTSSNDPYIKICNTTNNCTLNAEKPVTIAITNNSGSAIDTNNFKIVLTFTPYYEIFYTINGSTTNLGDVLAGDTFTYTWQSNAPSAVTKDTGTGTLDTSNLPTITITGVASDIELSGSVSTSDIISGDGTQPNPYISNATTYDPNVSDLPTGYISYTSATGKPQIVVEEVNGTNQITSFEFMDNNGVTYDTSSNLDTKFNAFLGDTFTVDIVFGGNLASETGNYIFSAFEENNGVYNGFAIRVASSTSVTISTYVNVTRSGTNPLTPTYSSNATRISASGGKYTLQVTYDRYGRTQGGNKYAVLTAIAAQTRELYNNNSDSNRVPTSLTNATITVNGNGFDNNDNMSSMTVYTFKVTRN